jgi:hypothetical protein
MIFFSIIDLNKRKMTKRRPHLIDHVSAITMEVPQQSWMSNKHHDFIFLSIIDLNKKENAQM